MDHDSWNRHIASIWSELLAGHALDAAATVAEIGPGFADKIGLALAGCGFRGTLYVVEPTRAALDWVVDRYRDMLDRAEIVPVAEPLPSAVDSLPHAVGGLVMNHVLDDLILSAAISPDERDRIFGAIRPGNGSVPDVLEIWQRLLSEPERLGALRERVLDDLDRLVSVTDPRLFAASQYSSWFLTRNHLEAVDRLGAELVSDLEQRVGPTSDADRATLAHRGQDPGRWLVCERRPEEAEDRWTMA